MKTGGFGPMVAALELGQIDVAPVTEPLWSKVSAHHWFGGITSTR